MGRGKHGTDVFRGEVQAFRDQRFKFLAKCALD